MSKYVVPNKRAPGNYVIPSKREESANVVMTDASFPTLGKAVTTQTTKKVMNYLNEVIQGEQKKLASSSEQSEENLKKQGWVIRKIPKPADLPVYMLTWHNKCVGDGKWDYTEDTYVSRPLSHYEIDTIVCDEEESEEEPDDEPEEEEVDAY